jgi:hypothetical protein
LEGVFVGDAGYVLRQQEFKKLFEVHKRIISAARKNMKRLMTRGDKGRYSGKGAY